MQMKTMIAVIFLFCSTVAFAANFVCPNTFKTVMTGYTMDQVTAACGQPTSSSNSQGQMTLPVKQMQWIYTLPSSTTFNGYLHAPQMVIVFENDQVVEVSSSTSEAASLFACYRTDRIAVGNSTTQVLQQCGSPNFINYVQQARPQTVSSTQWVYNFGPYRPQMVFIFQNGILQQIQLGQIPQ